MKYLLEICLFVLMLRISAAYWIDSNDMSYLQYPEEDEEVALRQMNAVKRYGKCMRWGMICVPESSLKFTKCCNGLNCMCNIWKTHCKCRAKIG